jgi:hypothetical protein
LLRSIAADQRNARKYFITPEGEETLKGAWRTCLESQPLDIDSIIRVAYLAWTLGNDREASDFLQRAAMTLRARAATMQAQALELFDGVRHEVQGNAYRWLRTHCDAARLEAGAEALTELADQICGIGNMGDEGSKRRRGKKRQADPRH